MVQLALRAYRRHRGLKQQTLASMLGVDQATISRWEKGVSRPTLPQRRRVVDLLGQPQGLSPSLHMRVAVQLDPSPSSLLLGETWVWTLANAAARAGHLGQSLHYLAQPVLTRLNPVRRAMFAEARRAILRGEIVGARCVNSWTGPDGWTGEPVETGFFIESFHTFSVHDGEVAIVARDYRLTADDLRQAGRPEGWSFTTLDDLLGGEGPAGAAAR